MTVVTTNIPSRLHSVASEHIVAGANEIFDDELNKRQSEINAEAQNNSSAITVLTKYISVLSNILFDIVGWRDLFIWNDNNIWANDIQLNIPWPKE